MTTALLDRLTHHCEIVEPGTRPSASRTAHDQGLPRLRNMCRSSGTDAITLPSHVEGSGTLDRLWIPRDYARELCGRFRKAPVGAFRITRRSADNYKRFNPRPYEGGPYLLTRRGEA